MKSGVNIPNNADSPLESKKEYLGSESKEEERYASEFAQLEYGKKWELLYEEIEHSPLSEAQKKELQDGLKRIGSFTYFEYLSAIGTMFNAWAIAIDKTDEPVQKILIEALKGKKIILEYSPLKINPGFIEAHDNLEEVHDLLSSLMTETVSRFEAGKSKRATNLTTPFSMSFKQFGQIGSSLPKTRPIPQPGLQADKITIASGIKASKKITKESENILSPKILKSTMNRVFQQYKKHMKVYEVYEENFSYASLMSRAHTLKTAIQHLVLTGFKTNDHIGKIQALFKKSKELLENSQYDRDEKFSLMHRQLAFIALREADGELSRFINKNHNKMFSGDLFITEDNIQGILFLLREGLKKTIQNAEIDAAGRKALYLEGIKKDIEEARENISKAEFLKGLMHFAGENSLVENCNHIIARELLCIQTLSKEYVTEEQESIEQQIRQISLIGLDAQLCKLSQLDTNVFRIMEINSAIQGMAREIAHNENYPCDIDMEVLADLANMESCPTIGTSISILNRVLKKSNFSEEYINELMDRFSLKTWFPDVRLNNSQLDFYAYEVPIGECQDSFLDLPFSGVRKQLDEIASVCGASFREQSRDSSAVRQDKILSVNKKLYHALCETAQQMSSQEQKIVELVMGTITKDTLHEISPVELMNTINRINFDFYDSSLSSFRPVVGRAGAIPVSLYNPANNPHLSFQEKMKTEFFDVSTKFLFSTHAGKLCLSEQGSPLSVMKRTPDSLAYTRLHGSAEIEEHEKAGKKKLAMQLVQHIKSVVNNDNRWKNQVKWHFVLSLFGIFKVPTGISNIRGYLNGCREEDLENPKNIFETMKRHIPADHGNRLLRTRSVYEIISETNLEDNNHMTKALEDLKKLFPELNIGGPAHPAGAVSPGV